MSEVKTLATLVLGGFFDHDELGDIDIHYSMGNVEALQEQLVTSLDDVHVELVSRIDYDAAQYELAALRNDLGEAKGEYDRSANKVAALREELAGAKHDIASFLETMAKVCDLLGINTEDAKHAEGNPSDVFFSHATVMQQRLTAAEQRNATLETELRNIRQSCELSKLRDARIDALLVKPTESGASE